MTTAPKSVIGRRPLIAGLATFGVAILGGALYELPGLFRRRYPKTPFDDLLDRLADRASAARLGAEVLRTSSNFDVQAEAGKLRVSFAGASLADVTASDLAADHIDEVRGWVLPDTLTRLCALAAKAG
jgi:hypothetical protein